MLLLLALMLVGVNVSWAQTSFGKAEMQSSSTLTIGDHDMDVTGGITKAFWYTSVNATNHTTKEEKLFVKLWSDESYIEVRFAKGSVVANDIVRVETSAFYTGNQTLGYKVEGSSDKVTKNVTDQAIYYIDQTLTSNNILSGDGYDYIRINRNGLSGCAYHSVEILTNRLIAASFKQWESIEGNTSTGIATGGDIITTLGSSVNAGGTVFGDGSVGYLKYVNVKGGDGAIMPDAKCLIIEGNAGVQVRILFNRVAHEGSLQEQTVTIPSNGKLIFDISSYDTFHLNAIKIPWNSSTGNVVNLIKISNTLTTYTVNFSGLYGGGNVTATANGNPINSGDKVAEGTNVTFTPVPSGENLAWKWVIDGTEKYSQDPQTITVTKDITVNHEFGNVYVNVYTNNASLGTVNIKHGDQNATTFHVTPWAGEFTLTASPTANGKFMGWYKDADHTQKIDDAEATYTVTNPSGTNNYFAFFVEGANTITKPGCGGYYMDQSKLNAGTATLNVSGGKGTVVTGAGGGYVSVKFDQAYSFTNLKKYTVSGTNVAANLNNVEFLKNGVGIENANFYSGCSDKNLTDQNKNSVLTSVDEIRFHFKGNTTTTIDYIYFEVDHGPRTKPTLANPTAAEMKIFSDETLQLRITNTAGFWREYTDDTYKIETTEHGVGVKPDGSTDWKPSYDISGLTPGDYYFGIKDGGNCAENNKHHESGLVTVHVKVIAPIASVNVNGTKRYYDVYAPAGISGTVGVVFSLHGASNDYDNGRVDFNGIAETEKNVEGKRFVVVYPRGLMRQLRGTERGWESYTESNTEDVDFFKEIVKELKKTYTVDDKRIYLAGFSNGGMMAYKAAHQAGDFFAAFASVGGFPVNESHLWHAGKQPTPFIHIQGEADTVFPSATYNVNTIIHNMVYRNGAQFNPWDTSDGRVSQDGNMISENNNSGTKVVTKDCHSAEAGGADYFFYKIKDMGHTWSYNWDGVDGDDVASTMWKFFNKADKVKLLDKSLKFRVYDETTFMDNAEAKGFDDVNSGKTVLAYGKNKTNDDKNLYHSLQFAGEGSGTPHYLRLNMETEVVANSTDYFLVSLTKYGDSNPVFAKRYQAGKGKKDLYINFTAPNGVNEYRLVVTKSRAGLDVKVNRVEFHSGMCEDNPGIEENDVYFTDIRTLLGISDDPAQRKLNPIYQPVYGQSYNSLAKEYLPIAKITVPTIEDPDKDPNRDARTINDVLKYTNDGQTEATTITSIAGSTTSDESESKIYVNIADSPKDTNNSSIKSKTAVILGNSSTDQYPIDEAEGINISHYGRAMMPEYINGTVGDFPSHGVIAMQMQGTLDFTVLAKNVNTTDAGRRVLRVYYTNDQLNSEIRELKEWDFYGTRNELGTTYGQQLSYSIRMQHLGQDGTCVVFVTYEGRKENNVLKDYAEDHDDVWIKGIVIKRPDLDVTIGRTDKLRYENGAPINSKNDKLTCFGENKPYQWNFGTSAFNNTKKSDINKKKVNQYDGRTYICGVGPNGEQLIDHLLVYSDGKGDDKASFDGRPTNGKHKGFEDDETDNNEHIEFNHPTKYSGINTQGANQEGYDKNRRSFNPILSNGLKVNVTGSGWFTIACSAPNGPVNMKVLSSTNGGNTYINLLREFVVSNEEDPDKNTSGYKKETSWHTYRVYLKAHKERAYRDTNGNIEAYKSKGFWDGNEIGTLDPEDTQMSLYVVFDKLTEYNGQPLTYMDGSVEADAQLNIHYMQWINEMPADYVFQREEDPTILNSRQSIIEGGDAEHPGLYWQAGTSMTEGKTFKTPTGLVETERIYSSAYESINQDARENGQDSGDGSISQTLECQWNVAAKATTQAHTEADYKGTKGNPDYSSFNKVYSLEQAKNGAPDQRLEFALPMSGSFLRFMPMKNQFISAWIVPQNNVTAANIYVLDETGKPIPYCPDADTENETNRSKITQEAREHGWVNSADGMTWNADENKKYFATNDGTTAVRIDFAALAGKEYFICSDNATISLARLQATNNSGLAAVEEISTPLTALTDKANNSVAISKSMEGIGRYVKSVTLNREFKAGYWASLVLPFSMNEKKLEDVFGPGTKCLHFTDVNTETNVTKLTHHYYNMVVAGRPVFICPGQNVTNPEITDVTLQASTVTPTTTESGFAFVASYDNQEIRNQDLYMNNANAIKCLKVDAGKTTYPGMRAFIKNNAGYDFGAAPSTSTSGTKATFINFDEVDEGIVTGIEELITEEFGENTVLITKSTKAYDLSGRIAANGSDINRLPAGIYVVNGKKFIVK